ncbi:MAG: MATE family multidrug resistance protein [Gammaproteobacteria bacterium]|jgi:MATE family multidrug resistance protein
MSRQDLPETPGQWHGRVWALAWPTMIANVSVPLVGMVDTAVVGHLPDPIYIGAVAVGAVVFHFLQWGMSFLRMGTTGFTAQAFGARDTTEVNATAVRALIIALAAGLLVLVCKVPLVNFAMVAIDASAQVDGASREYLDIRLWSVPAAFANLALLGVLFGLQRMRDALWVQLALNAINMVLDLYFVLVLDWGVEGVAWASVIAEFAACALACAFVWRALRRIGGSWSGLALTDRTRLHGLLRVNANIFVRTLAVQLTFFSFTALGARQGDVTLAANAVLLHLFTVLSSALDGFAFAVEALAGNAFGARNPRALRAIVLSAARWSALCGVSFSAIYAVAGMQIVGLLTSVPAVIEECAQYLPWVTISPLLTVWSYLLDGVYFGTTRTREMRNSMLIAMTLFYVCAWLLTPELGNHGLWLAVMVFVLVRAVLLAAWYPRIERAAGG